MMQYKSIADLAETITRNLHRVPRDVDLIVGIPRSGLLAANMLALSLNLPLTDFEGFLDGRIIATGKWRGLATHGVQVRDCRRILVFDDSVFTGRAIGEARSRVAELGLDNVLFGAAYVVPGAEDLVEIGFEQCPMPRVFEWNVMHHAILRRSCVDIDGVLCRDPSPAQNDDGPLYRRFLEEAEPLYTPTLPIAHLVTCRLEKYREATIRWLDGHGIQFQHLHMMQYETKEERLRHGNHGEYKADVCRRVNAEFFVESSWAQAKVIADGALVPVLCFETNALVLPSAGGLIRGATRQIPAELTSRARFAASRIGRWLSGTANSDQKQ